MGYLVSAPDSSDSMGGVGDYTIDSTLFVDDFEDGTEYVMDSDTVTLVFNTDSIDSWENGDNVVGVRVLMNFAEDETSSGSVRHRIMLQIQFQEPLSTMSMRTSQDSNGMGRCHDLEPSGTIRP